MPTCANCPGYNSKLMSDWSLENEQRFLFFSAPFWPSWAPPKPNSRRSLGTWLQSWPKKNLWSFCVFPSYYFHSMEVQDETLDPDEAAGKKEGGPETQTRLVTTSLKEQVWSCLRVELIIFRKLKNAVLQWGSLPFGFLFTTPLKQLLYTRLLISLFYFNKTLKPLEMLTGWGNWG